MEKSNITTGQIEILLRMGRENDCLPGDLLKLSEVFLADGIIDQKEAATLLSWLKKNAKGNDNLITRILLSRVNDMFFDGKFDDEERAELLFLLNNLHGETKESSLEWFSSNLPFCDPPPEVIFADKGFCLTGQFAYGPRSLCHEAIEERGGKIEKRINWRVDYLVMGTLCTGAWAHPTYGRKIEESLLLKSKKEKNIYIISEDHWAQAAFKLSANDD